MFRLIIKDQHIYLRQLSNFHTTQEVCYWRVLDVYTAHSDTPPESNLIELGRCAPTAVHRGSNRQTTSKIQTSLIHTSLILVLCARVMSDFQTSSVNSIPCESRGIQECTNSHT